MRILRRLRSIVLARKLDADVAEELRFHIEMETAKLVARGMEPSAARLEATRSFGGVARYRDETHDSRGTRALEDFARDLRLGVRALARNRAASVVTILTLAVGIGGTTAMFSALHGVLLSPLPYANADRILTVWQTNERTGIERGEASPANFMDWRDRNTSFEYLAAAEPFSFDFLGPDGPEVFTTALVTSGFFEAAGIAPLLGRVFTSEEYTRGHENVVIISERLWRARFGADSALVDSVITLDRTPMTVVGIMPARMTLPYLEDTWAPKIFRPDEGLLRTGGYYEVLGRLKDGVTIEAARAEMQAIGAQLAREYPAANASVSVSVVPLGEALVGRTRNAMLILFGAVALVLLICCANVASLQLAQVVRRRREIAIRAAIGAGRGRLFRQLLAECLVLALLGGFAGVMVAQWGVDALRTLAPADFPRLAEIRVSPLVVVFALGTSIATAIVFTLVPFLDIGTLRLGDVISAGDRTTATRARGRAHNTLVVTEVALALVLLIGAGLLMRSFASLLEQERGFRSDHAFVATTQSWSFYPTAADRVTYVRTTSERLAALPGVRAVGAATSLPLSAPIGMERTVMRVEGHESAEGVDLPSYRVTAMTPRFIDALGMSLRRGRDFAAADDAASAPVAIVNESFARRHWDVDSAIGKRVTLRFQAAPVSREIIGVVADVRHSGLDRDPEPTVFVPHTQAPSGSMHFVIRTIGDPATLQRTVRAALLSVNATMPISRMATLQEFVDDSVRERRLHLAILGVFSLVALALAAIGIYGVMSHVTAARTREIGLRVAVGARAGDVVAMVVRQGLVLALVGVALGFVAAAGLTRLLSGMLYGVTPLDPVTYGAAVMVLLLAATVACVAPARRASKVDPLVALRAE